jgi:hypothetical protein
MHLHINENEHNVGLREFVNPKSWKRNSVTAPRGTSDWSYWHSGEEVSFTSTNYYPICINHSTPHPPTPQKKYTHTAAHLYQIRSNANGVIFWKKMGFVRVNQQLWWSYWNAIISNSDNSNIVLHEPLFVKFHPGNNFTCIALIVLERNIDSKVKFPHTRQNLKWRIIFLNFHPQGHFFLYARKLYPEQEDWYVIVCRC